MKEETKKMKEILEQNKDKRVLILGTEYSGKKEILKNLKIGEDYDEILNHLLEEKYGYVYITESEREVVKKTMAVKKGVPMFSEHLLDCDLIIFLYTNEKVLKLKATMDFKDAASDIYIQNKLKSELKKVSTPVIKIETSPKEIHPENMSRNVLICGKNLKNKICIMDKKEEVLEYYEKEGKLLVRFPYLYYFDTLEEIKRKQGFLLVVDEALLPKKIMEIDKKYRSLFKNFHLIFIVTEKERKFWKTYKFAHITYYPKEYVLDSDFHDDVMNQYYSAILNAPNKRMQKRKVVELNRIREFLKDKKTIKTSELETEFHMSKRQVERVMNELNEIDNNIGYDYTNNEWYII